MNNKVWFITGASSGIGFALANAVLRRGYRAVLGARSVGTLQALAEDFPETALVVPLDVTVDASIENSIRTAEERFGGIDVLVNNAGVGYLGAVEEGQDRDIRWCFDTNFFGPASVIRTALPRMRSRGEGTILNISSVAGFVGHAGMGYYSASKFALEGLTEALWMELEPLGISVVLVEPGGFRTGIVQRNRVADRIDAYGGTAGAFVDFVQNAAPEVFVGDPEKAAEVLVKLAMAEQKPRRVVLGSDAITTINGKLSVLAEEYKEAAELAHTTDFDIAPQS